MKNRRKKKQEDADRTGTYQVVRDTRKIKKMSRKQLKMLSKGDASGGYNFAGKGE